MINGVILLLFFTSCLVSAQSIPLVNSSFEDTPAHSRPPQGWFFCGERAVSPPDINPHPAFGVVAPAWHGRTYVGLVTRADSTYEAIGQALASPLRAGSCYRLRVFTRRSRVMQSWVTHPFFHQTYITAACRLRVFGTKRRCHDRQLLATSYPVYHHNWQSVELHLHPDTDLPFLLLEAYYVDDTLSYGNVQLDQISLDVSPDCTHVNDPSPTPSYSSIDHPLHIIGQQIHWEEKSSRVLADREIQSKQAARKVSAGMWQLAQMLQADPTIILEVGIRASSNYRFRESKKSWKKAWRPMRKLVSRQRILFTRIEDTSDLSVWTYQEDAAPYWLRLLP